MDDREKLMERYDDAAFALMMDEYAEAEGEALLAEFRAAAEAGDLPEIPEETDQACRNAIRKEYARRERKVRLRRFRQRAARVAVAVFAVIGIMSTMIMSVEAWRVPFWKQAGENYGIFQYFDFLNMRGNSDADKHEIMPEEDPVMMLVPAGYRRVSFKVENGRIDSRYETDDGKYISFNMSFYQGNGTRTIEEETEYNKYVTVLDKQAIFYSSVFLLEQLPDEEVYIELTWEDLETETAYRVTTNGMDETELVAFCEGIIRCFLDAYIDQPSVVPDALEGYLPAEYEKIYSGTTMGMLLSIYEADEKRIIFDFGEAEGEMMISVESPVISDTNIAGYEATVMVGDNELEEIGTVWIDEERNLAFYLNTEFMSEEDHLALCEYLAEYYKDVELPMVSTLIWG